jgi:hypothetical protein
MCPKYQENTDTRNKGNAFRPLKAIEELVNDGVRLHHHAVMRANPVLKKEPQPGTHADENEPWISAQVPQLQDLLLYRRTGTNQDSRFTDSGIQQVVCRPMPFTFPIIPGVINPAVII